MSIFGVDTSLSRIYSSLPTSTRLVACVEFAFYNSDTIVTCTRS